MSAFDEELQLAINKHNINTSKLILVKEKDNYIVPNDYAYLKML